MKENCIFDSSKLCNDCNQCDLCDILPNKTCNNCGKCLEQEGVDIRAIRIEDIAKNSEENEFVEGELDDIIDDTNDDIEEIEESEEDYSVESVTEDVESVTEDYEDAWDHIEYLDGLQDVLDDEVKLGELTQEQFPGLLKFKRRD
ncbi:Zn-finger domain-containing protein [Clostridium polyendosporum]|uniref:Zn-finger domain-containing protein n=1 Tax=Clostridium polyendosporum TaxID=69208 RepID=A0A919S2I3_9CLOT|nr:hypothetical protein [Clostridium polyendosporum]GIM30654.1 Zn-finger domain-containing protein [Clostridium polyendosporum]